MTARAICLAAEPSPKARVGTARRRYSASSVRHQLDVGDAAEALTYHRLLGYLVRQDSARTAEGF